MESWNAWIGSDHSASCSVTVAEFKEQLSCSEKHLSQVPKLLLSHLGEQHLEQLSRDTVQICQSLELVLHESEDRKVPR